MIPIFTDPQKCQKSSFTVYNRSSQAFSLGFPIKGLSQGKAASSNPSAQH
ncbi:hypothetical protein R3I94_005410 [Phoxinus phoxinus]